MRQRDLWRKAVVMLTITFAFTTGGALLGQATGNIYVQITDTDGAPLPGVTVMVSGGVGAPKSQITEARGKARFLGLAPGQYKVSGKRDGFGSVEYPSVTVTVGRNTAIVLELEPAGKDVITITS